MSDTLTTPTPVAAGRSPLWTTAPGFGIAVDLTPPEVVNARQVAVLRRVVAAGLAALVVGCAGGWYLAAQDSDDARGDLSFASDQTLGLQATGRSYADVVSIQKRVQDIDGRVATVMAGDVDVVELLDVLHTDLPSTMRLTQQTISISGSGVADATTGGAAGDTRIGTITMTGTGTTLSDLADYIDALETVPGVVDVVPLSNAVRTDGAGTQFSLSLSITDVLLSGRYAEGE